MTEPRSLPACGSRAHWVEAAEHRRVPEQGLAAPPQPSPCRDAQRVEELFAKNHQLREQQKALKENLRVLENR